MAQVWWIYAEIPYGRKSASKLDLSFIAYWLLSLISEIKMCADGILISLQETCAPEGWCMSNEHMCVLAGKPFLVHEQAEWPESSLHRASIQPDMTRPARQIYGRTNNFSTKHLDMCAGGMVPLSALKYAAAGSTDMNLKVCALTGIDEVIQFSVCADGFRTYKCVCWRV